MNVSVLTWRHDHIYTTFQWDASVVYSQSGLGLRLLELCLSLEATRADRDFPSFRVKEFFLWDSCSLDISSEAEKRRRSWSPWRLRDKKLPPVAVDASALPLSSPTPVIESSVMCSGSAGKLKTSLWLFGRSVEPSVDEGLEMASKEDNPLRSSSRKDAKGPGKM